MFVVARSEKEGYTQPLVSSTASPNQEAQPYGYKFRTLRQANWICPQKLISQPEAPCQSRSYKMENVTLEHITVHSNLQG